MSSSAHVASAKMFHFTLSRRVEAPPPPSVSSKAAGGSGVKANGDSTGQTDHDASI